MYIEPIDNPLPLRRCIHLVNSDASNVRTITVAYFYDRLGPQHRHCDESEKVQCHPPDANRRYLRSSAKLTECKEAHWHQENVDGSQDRDEERQNGDEVRLFVYDHRVSYFENLILGEIVSFLLGTVVMMIYGERFVKNARTPSELEQQWKLFKPDCNAVTKSRPLAL